MAELTVLGIGNILMRDEGVGVRVLEAVREHRQWPPGVEFIDGGAGGMNLLNVIEEADRLVVFDAADMALPAGEFRVIAAGQISQEDMSDRVSMHRVPFIETLKLCEQFFRRPEDVSILAIQPAVVDYGRELSEQLRDAMPRIVQAAVELVQNKLAIHGEADGRKE